MAENFYIYETLYHVMARLSLLVDLMEEDEISLECAAEHLNVENERLANLCNSLLEMMKDDVENSRKNATAQLIETDEKGETPPSPGGKEKG